MVRFAFLLLIVVDADHRRIEYRGDVDSTYEILPGKNNFKITSAFYDMKNMEHPRIKRLLLSMLIET